MNAGGPQRLDEARTASAAGRGARVVLLAALAVVALGGLARAAGPGQADEGKTLFQTNCASCHSIGGGALVGPDLKGVSGKSSPAWVQAFIEAPDKVIASGDPRAIALLKQFKNVKMPNLGMTAAQAAALVAYIDSRSGAAPAAPGTTTTTGAAKGDPAAGKNEFTGDTRLANGGPPCLSCHSIAGTGSLGGGALGPDLTGAYAKYGGAKGVPAVLASLPFPTMKPIFDARPLTAAEQANLAAFLADASSEQRPADAVWKLVALGLVVAAALLGLAFVLWPRRRLVVRRRIAPTYTPTRKG